ncbi:MAG: hypothetical protein OEL84_03685 [Nitrosopumilus sp.]|nr:hypothetical protein [Nitrosopumilus sp.]
MVKGIIETKNQSNPLKINFECMFGSQCDSTNGKGPQTKITFKTYFDSRQKSAIVIASGSTVIGLVNTSFVQVEKHFALKSMIVSSVQNSTLIFSKILPVSTVTNSTASTLFTKSIMLPIIAAMLVTSGAYIAEPELWNE